MDNYFLTGTFSFSCNTDSSPATRYCIVIGERAFHGSEIAMRVLAAIDGHSGIDAITANVNRSMNGIELAESDVRRLIETHLLPTGLVGTAPQRAETTHRGQRYLFLSHTIVPQRAVNIVSRWFVGLFSRYLAAMLVVLSCVLIGLWCRNLYADGINPWGKAMGFGFTLSDSVLAYVLLFACFMFHEFGHAAASRRFGVRPAEIGFGLYLLFPVFYCNVTEIWRLPKHKRIVVTLGGAYFQLLASAVLILFQLSTGSRALSFVIGGNLLAMLVTLNPFFRFDGYWIYSDLFSIPNLRERSNDKIAAVLRAALGDRRVGQTSTALNVYAAGSAVFFSGFAIFAAKTSWLSFAALPGQLNAAIAAYNTESSWEMAFNIGAAAGAYLILLAGCLLTLLYMIAIIIRGIRVLVQTLGASDIEEMRSTPHV